MSKVIPLYICQAPKHQRLITSDIYVIFSFYFDQSIYRNHFLLSIEGLYQPMLEITVCNFSFLCCLMSYRYVMWNTSQCLVLIQLISLLIYFKKSIAQKASNSPIIISELVLICKISKAPSNHVPFFQTDFEIFTYYLPNFAAGIINFSFLISSSNVCSLGDKICIQ